MISSICQIHSKFVVVDIGPIQSKSFLKKEYRINNLCAMPIILFQAKLITIFNYCLNLSDSNLNLNQKVNFSRKRYLTKNSHLGLMIKFIENCLCIFIILFLIIIFFNLFAGISTTRMAKLIAMAGECSSPVILASIFWNYINKTLLKKMEKNH